VLADRERGPFPDATPIDHLRERKNIAAVLGMQGLAKHDAFFPRWPFIELSGGFHLLFPHARVQAVLQGLGLGTRSGKGPHARRGHAGHIETCPGDMTPFLQGTSRPSLTGAIFRLNLLHHKKI